MKLITYDLTFFAKCHLPPGLDLICLLYHTDVSVSIHSASVKTAGSLILSVRVLKHMQCVVRINQTTVFFLPIGSIHKDNYVWVKSHKLLRDHLGEVTSVRFRVNSSLLQVLWESDVIQKPKARDVCRRNVSYLAVNKIHKEKERWIWHTEHFNWILLSIGCVWFLCACQYVTALQVEMYRWWERTQEGK